MFRLLLLSFFSLLSWSTSLTIHDILSSQYLLGKNERITSIPDASGIRFLPLHQILLTNAYWKVYIRLDLGHLCNEIVDSASAQTTWLERTRLEFKHRDPYWKSIESAYKLLRDTLDESILHCQHFQELHDITPPGKPRPTRPVNFPFFPPDDIPPSQSTTTAANIPILEVWKTATSPPTTKTIPTSISPARVSTQTSTQRSYKPPINIWETTPHSFSRSPSEPENYPPRIRRDAVLPIFGKILHSLFGVSTDHQYQLLKADLADVAAVMQNYSNIAGKQLTYINETNSLLFQQQRTLFQLREQIQNLPQNFSFEMTGVRTEMHTLAKTLLASRNFQLVQLMAETFHQHLQTVDDIFLSASEGRLHNKLLPPTTLRNELRKIEKLLPDQFSFEIPIQQLYIYYSQPYLQTVTTGSGFAFLLKIPLRHGKDSFQLYSARSFPVRLPNSTLFGEIVNIPPYIAISDSKTQYVELSYSDMLNCVGNVLKTCSLSIPIRSFTSPTCLSALYKGQNEFVHSLCEKRISQYSQTHAFRIPHTDLWLIALSKPMKLQLHCLSPSKTTHRGLFSKRLLQGVIAISIPSRCTITGDDFSLPASFSEITALDWTGFQAEDLPLSPTTLFSDDNLQLLSEIPPLQNRTMKKSYSNSDHKTLLDILQKYDKRARSFDDLRQEIDATRKHVFSSTDAFTKHLSEPATWATIFATIAVSTILATLAYLIVRSSTFFHLPRRFFRRRQRRAHPDVLGMELVDQNPNQVAAALLPNQL